MNPIVLKGIYTLISLFVIVNYGLILAGTMAQVRAKVQGRIGQPIYQPYIDILKNNAKRTAIYHGVMFYLGPVFRLAGGIGTYLLIPGIYGSAIFENFSFNGDILLVVYFMFFGQLGMALGAGDSGHPYSPIGVGRGLAQMTAFEVPMTLAILSLAIKHNTLSITEIVAAQQGSVFAWTFFTNPFAMAAGMIAFLGSTMGNPFSIVIAPQEIPIGPPTEYHSNMLGMLQTNRAIFTGAKLVLWMNLFFGGATNIFEMVIKTFCIYLFTVIVGQAFPRFRTEQSIRFFLGVPALLGLAAIIFELLQELI